MKYELVYKLPSPCMKDMKKQEILLNVLRLHKVNVKTFFSDQLITSDSLQYS